MADTPATPEPSHKPLTTREPWAYVGISRSAFYRLLSKGEAPAPVSIPGTWPHWRVGDLDKWVAGLKQSRRRYHNRRPTRKLQPAPETMPSA